MLADDQKLGLSGAYRELNKDSQDEFDRECWFAQRPEGVPHSREYEDETRTEPDREHWFLDYWGLYVKTYRGMTPSQLQILIEYKRWTGAVRTLIYDLYEFDALSDESIHLLLSELQGNDFAISQLTALQMLRNSAPTATEKLARSLDLKADWATRKIIESLEEHQLTEAIHIVNESKRPKSTKRRCIEAFRARQHSG